MNTNYIVNFYELKQILKKLEKFRSCTHILPKDFSEHDASYKLNVIKKINATIFNIKNLLINTNRISTNPIDVLKMEMLKDICFSELKQYNINLHTLEKSNFPNLSIIETLKYKIKTLEDKIKYIDNEIIKVDKNRETVINISNTITDNFDILKNLETKKII